MNIFNTKDMDNNMEYKIVKKENGLQVGVVDTITSWRLLAKRFDELSKDKPENVEYVVKIDKIGVDEDNV